MAPVAAPPARRLVRMRLPPGGAGAAAGVLRFLSPAQADPALPDRPAGRHRQFGRSERRGPPQRGVGRTGPPAWPSAPTARLACSYSPPAVATRSALTQSPNEPPEPALAPA